MEINLIMESRGTRQTNKVMENIVNCHDKVMEFYYQIYVGTLPLTCGVTHDIYMYSIGLCAKMYHRTHMCIAPTICAMTF